MSNYIKKTHKLDFDEKELMADDYIRLKKITDNLLLEDIIEYETIINNITKKRSYVRYIDTVQIIKLGLSEQEISYVLECLDSKDIKLKGEFSPYEKKHNKSQNTITFDNSKLPAHYSKEVQKEKFIELSQTKDKIKRNEIISDLVLHNMRLINYVISTVPGILRNPRSFGLELDDIRQLGYEGLIRAVASYNIDLGVSFSTYAFSTILYNIKRNIAIISNIPEDYYWKFYKYVKVVERENQTTIDNNPELLKDVIELASSNGVKMTTKNYSGLQLDYIALESDLEDEVNNNICEFEDSTHDKVASAMEYEALEDLLTILSPKEETIIKMRNGFNNGKISRQREIAELFSVSHTRVYEIEKKALKKMRQSPKFKCLER